MDVLIYQKSGEPSKLAVPAALASTKIVPTLLHQVIVAEAANTRAPHGHSKTRSEVSGGGRKPWKQKGTGRARASSTRSPLWPGGGIAFGPKIDRNFSKLVNRTMRSRAFAMALASKLKNGKVAAVESWQLDAPKAKQFLAALTPVALQGRRTLLILNEMNADLVLAARNIHELEMTSVASAGVSQILNADRIILDRAALEALFVRVGAKAASEKATPKKTAEPAAPTVTATEEQA